MSIGQSIRTLRALHLGAHWRRVHDNPNTNGSWCRKYDGQFEQGNGDAVQAAWVREVEQDAHLAYLVLNVFRRYANDDVKAAAGRALYRPIPAPAAVEPTLFG